MVPSAKANAKEFYLRFVAGGDERPTLGNLCAISFSDTDGQNLKPIFELTPAALIATLYDGERRVGTAKFALGAGEVLHIYAENIVITFGLNGSRYDYAFTSADGRDCVVAAGENLKLSPFVHKGGCKVTGQWRRDHAENVAISFSGETIDAGIQIHERLAPPIPLAHFSDAQRASAQDFQSWAVDNQMSAAVELAQYILWANTVPKGGILTAPAIYMSKNHMINIWSWDNAFSAIGVAKLHPQLAFDQFAAIFDHQDESGLLPDFVHDKGKSYSFTKPPVHGWAIAYILDAYGPIFTAEQCLYLRDKLQKQLHYWLTYTRADEEHLPSYAHGNDSGWDNASFFAENGPVEGPDLPTFLALTARMISRISATIGETDVAQTYDSIENKLIELLVAKLWDGGTFQVRHQSRKDLSLPDKSLIQFMPLMLGEKLPKDIAQKLIERFNDLQLLTQWGVATEAPMSTYYEADGYWRGPIWAPTTMLIVDGMLQQNERTLAHQIMSGFIAVCEKSGMAENFDALTGQGLRDPAFAWTSAVYLRFKIFSATQEQDF